MMRKINCTLTIEYYAERENHSHIFYCALICFIVRKICRKKTEEKKNEKSIAKNS